MILRRFYDEKLAQASYLIGCAATGEALVVDANRDVEQYVRAAANEGLRITHITETHIHADYASGSRELALRAGAQLYLSNEGDADWKYAYAEDARAVLVRNGDRFRVGNVQIEVVHTPGHTPEHVCFLVTDTAGADRPMGILTGDFVFVGDVGRPDLLERAANYAGTMQASARSLFASLAWFKQLDDYLQVWPGHGAGSACGKALGAVPQTTVGYEKLFNWALGFTDEDRFVEAVLAGQPEPPRYFAEMKRINRDGPDIRNAVPQPSRLPYADLPRLLQDGAVIVDTRLADAYADRHVPGTLNIPLTRNFSTWAGWLLPYDRDFYLIVGDSGGEVLAETLQDLAKIGLDRVAGYFHVDGLNAWITAGGEPGSVAQIGQAALDQALLASEVTVLDVRGQAEWEAGHLPGALNIPLGHLPERIGELRREQYLVVHCQSGGRSAIAASLLRLHGFDRVLNYAGGFDAWRAAGRPIEREFDASIVES